MFRNGPKRDQNHTIVGEVDADIRGAAEYRKWADDYILGFFEGVAGNPDTEHLSRFSKHPRILGILDGFDSMKRYERLEAK